LARSGLWRSCAPTPRSRADLSSFPRIAVSDSARNELWVMSSDPGENSPAKLSRLFKEFRSLLARDLAGTIITSEIAFAATLIEVSRKLLKFRTEYLGQDIECRPMVAHASRSITGCSQYDRGELKSRLIGRLESQIDRDRVDRRVLEIAISDPQEVTDLTGSGPVPLKSTFRQELL